jgi:hypothetical protein
MAIYTYLLFLAAITFASCQSDHGNLTFNVCWRDTYFRGQGSIPDHCNDGSELSGPLCFPKCQTNYSGAGPVCLENCPPNFNDLGLVCNFPRDSYFPCPWYDICGITVAKGCFNCSAGYNKEGCACVRPGKTIKKKSYGRGPGSTPKCSPDLDDDGGVCYPKCKEGYEGTGPICWQSGSGNGTFEFQCNLFAYGETRADCDQLNQLLKEAGITSVTCIGSLAISIITGHILGPKRCRDLMKEVFPKLINTPVCGGGSGVVVVPNDVAMSILNQ